MNAFRRLAIGSVAAAGLMTVALSPALAHHKSWHHNGPGYNTPEVVYVQPQPIYVAPRPVYVAPQPVYVAPQPTKPEINIVVPIFD